MCILMVERSRYCERPGHGPLLHYMFRYPSHSSLSHNAPARGGICLFGLLALLILLSPITRGHGQTLPLPPRETNALSGTEFVQQITALPREERELWILAQVLRGNVPGFIRHLTPVSSTRIISGRSHTVLYHVAPDYLAIGSDEDYFLCPMTPLLAQRIADALGCTLPTRRMVNQIWTNATVKLAPAPIAPSPEMTTVPVFDQHNALVRDQRQAVLETHPLGELVGGTKKDVVISSRIYGPFANPGVTKPVVIYGWHYLSGTPIQPLYNGHGETYADYSHGIRLVQLDMHVDNQPNTVTNICAHPLFHPLLSDEGAIATNRYSIDPLPPTLLVQPTSQTLSAGRPARLDVLVAGDSPLHYQWRKDGTNLPGASLPALELSNPQAVDQGVYQVWITNASGAVLSHPATLTVSTSRPSLNWIGRPSPERIALQITNVTPSRHLIDATTDFGTWQPVATLTANTPSPPFIDRGLADQSHRFYRAAETAGTDLIDFDAFSSGSPALFQNPSYSGSTAAYLDLTGDNPDSTVVTTNPLPDITGSKVLHVAWSFEAGAVNPWLRLTTHSASALPNPTLAFDDGLCFDAYADRDLFIALGLRETDASGPIGSDGGTSGPIEWMGATTDNSVSQPKGRRLNSGAWTRLCFVLSDEPVRAFTGDGVLSSTTSRGVLEHLALVPAEGSGVYHLYLDNFQTFTLR